MIIEPTIDRVKVTCMRCRKVSCISWDDVNNELRLFDDTYGEIICPNCGCKGAVYTREKIDDIKHHKVKDY